MRISPRQCVGCKRDHGPSCPSAARAQPALAPAATASSQPARPEHAEGGAGQRQWAVGGRHGDMRVVHFNCLTRNLAKAPESEDGKASAAVTARLLLR
eukprot:5946313-Lingulodinium_polyedra.AAC.1